MTRQPPTVNNLILCFSQAKQREKAQLPLLQFINDFLFKPHLHHLYPSVSAADPSALQLNTAL